MTPRAFTDNFVSWMVLVHLQATCSNKDHRSLLQMDFDFVKIIEYMFSLPEVGIMDIDKNETVINRSPIYYQRLGKLMESTSQR